MLDHPHQSNRASTPPVVLVSSPILHPVVAPAPMDTTMVPPSLILHLVVAHAPIDTAVVPYSFLPLQSFPDTHASPTIVEIQAVDGAILGAQSAHDEDIRLMNVEPVELVTHNSSSSGTHTSTGCSI